MLCYVMLIG
uniref:Uncharacterized protein n=1 Tax=Anguilla anguilla TaxID=7936 RepID=A0A0E9V8A7_ANGAN